MYIVVTSVEEDSDLMAILLILGTTVLSFFMNLMNAYMKDSSEFECIYAAYCYELNQQAKLEGMASSVAKINSVGLRLALKDLPSSDTIPALMKSLWSWDDLPCDVLFPSCDVGFTKVEKN